jgi:hypothetical protein
MIPSGPVPPPPTETEMESREQELHRDFTTPLPIFYIVASIIIILFLTVIILGVDVFHFF